MNFYESEDDLPLLLEITGLAKTALGVAKSNPLALTPFLAFMERLISMHGQKIEPSPIINYVTNDAVQVMAKNLMLMSYAGVKNDTTQECLKAMFGTLAACARKCPLFLMSLSRDTQPVGEVIRSSIETVPVAMASNETDIALSSIIFMKCLVSSYLLAKEVLVMNMNISNNFVSSLFPLPCPGILNGVYVSRCIG